MIEINIIICFNKLPMLTQDDLQAIQKIVKHEISDELMPVNSKLRLLQKDIAGIKKDVRKLKKDLDITITTFDHEMTDTKLRVDRINTHLSLPPLQLT